MDHYLHRSRAKYVLAGLLAAQLLLLGYQVHRPDAGGVRLVRLWSVEAILPVERVSQRTVAEVRNLFHSYLALRQVNQQNRDLAARLSAIELDNQRLREGAREAPTLRALLGFQRAYTLRTEPAEVISNGVTSDAQALYLDRGSSAGLTRNMAVISPDGLVGKLTQVLGASSQVLLVTDSESGVGALVGPQAAHGILRGLGAGRAQLRDVLKDEAIPLGAAVVTSGEDQVYPKGIPIGTVTAMHPSTDGVFQSLDVKLAANLDRLESVLVVTAALPSSADNATPGITAAEIRQAQLPSLPAAWQTSAPPPAALRLPANTPPAEGDALAAKPLPKIPHR